jgi:TIR domain/NACHT domain
VGRFRVALSFPGEHRRRIENIADALATELGRDAVLYDEWFRAEFNRPNLDTYLTRLYHDESDLIAVFLCEAYNEKEWCGLEWRACRDLLKHKVDDRLMFFKLDDADIPGLYSIDGYQDIRDMNDIEVAHSILSRLPGEHYRKETSPPVVSAPLVESDYVKLLGESLRRLQSERSFIDPWPKFAQTESGQVVSATQAAAQLRPDGELDAGMPSLRFSMQAKKLSVEELRTKYGGGDLDYEDYVSLVTSTPNPEISDVVGHLASIRPGWAIQILGAPGIGKSFILRLACLSLVTRHEQFGVVPFYLELRDSPREGFASSDQVLEFIARSVSERARCNPEVAMEFTARVLSEGRGAVFFDAIDEAGDPLASLRPVTELMRTKGREANRYVFSCRTFDQVPGLVAEELVLLPLSYRSLREYLRVALAHSPLKEQVEAQLRNAHFRQVLATPLVASAYARFVRDRGRLPKTLYEALTDGLQKRFWVAAIQDGFLDSSAAEEDFVRLYTPTAKVLRRLAHKMRNRMAPILPPRTLTLVRSTLPVSAPTPDPLSWALRSGVLYTTVEGRIAFGLHRYKELYLAEKWTEEHEKSGVWPQDVVDRIGRIMWIESLLLLGDLVTEQESFLSFLVSFCEDSYSELPHAGLVENYRLFEAVMLTAKMASSRCTNDERRQLYGSILLLVHQIALDERIPLTARLRIVRSIGTHGRASSADLLFAIHDDTPFISKDAFVRTSLQETALAAVAELIAAEVVGPDRIDEFVRRAGRRALKRDVTSILAESIKAPEINARVEKEIRKTHLRQSTWAVAIVLLVLLVIVMARAHGALGIWIMSILILLPCTVALWILRLRQGPFLKPERTPSDHDGSHPKRVDEMPEGELYSHYRDGALPYSPERFWIPKEGVKKGRFRSAIPVWSLPVYRTWVVSLITFVLSLAITIAQVVLLYLLSIKRIAEILRALLKYALFGVPAALTLGVAIYWIRSKSTRRLRAEARHRRERDWNERLQRVQEESERLRADDVDLNYIIEHLMEDVPFGPAGLGVVQARVEAIRRYMVADPDAVERLQRFIDEATSEEMKSLLWSVIDDMTRIHVLKEEKQLFGAGGQSAVLDSE